MRESIIEGLKTPVEECETQLDWLNWKIVYTRQAKKDAKTLAESGVKTKVQKLRDIISYDQYQTAPPYERLVGDMRGAVPVVSTFNID